MYFYYVYMYIFLYIRCNDKATVSARMSLVCLAYRLYRCPVSCVLILFQQINDDDDDEKFSQSEGKLSTSIAESHDDEEH